MPCYRPLRAYQVGSGKPFFSSVKLSPLSREIEIPCGQCIGCRLDYSRDWALRCVHESRMCVDSCFVTLTYRDADLPDDRFLCHRHVQLFLKRLRKQFDVRYFMCGEYGGKFGRPHYHILLFGFLPDDRKFFKTSDSGSHVFTSCSLDAKWQLGSTYTGDVTFESAAYIARYITDRENDFSTGRFTAIVDVTTGELLQRPKEYTQMSRHPGIGASWFARYWRDVFPRDYILLRGVKMPVPRYYDVLLERFDPDMLQRVKDVRRADMDRRIKLLSAEFPHLAREDVRRLDVEEQVKLVSIRKLKRSN